MKNIFLICLMAVASTHAFAQIQITLITSKIKADSVVITNQGQLFRAQAPGGNTVTLRLDTPREMDIYNIHIFRNTEKLHAQVWLNKGNITIKAHEENNKLVIDTVLNSPIYSYITYEYAPQNKRIRALKNADSLHYFLLNALETNKGNLFSCSILAQYIQHNKNAKERLNLVLPLAEQQNKTFDWFFLSPLNLKNINNAINPPVLDMNLYAFLDKDSAKHHVQLPNNNYTVLDFWFLNCPPCRKDHISIKADKEKWDAKGVQLISISIDQYEDKDRWNTYLEEHGYNWANYLQADEQTITSDYSIFVFPTYWVLDQSGKVVFMDNRYPELKSFLSIE